MDHLLVEWRGLPGCWEPFPDLFRRLIGDDWWDEISEERGRLYSPPAAFEGRGSIASKPRMALEGGRFNRCQQRSAAW